MVFQVTTEQIESLNEKQLVDLINKLLRIECEKFSIPVSCISITNNLKAADDGEDASVIWTASTPINTDWITSKCTVFQIKAETMGPARCKEEVQLKDKTDLKKRPRFAFENDGSYIVISNKDNIPEKGRIERKNGIKEALKNFNKPYADTANIEFYDASKLYTWINSSPQAINYFFQTFVNFDPIMFLEWEVFKNKFQQEFLHNYIPNKFLNELYKKIQEDLYQNKKHIRVIGLPGLGKTRLIYEILKSQESFFSNFLYLDCGVFKENSQILFLYRSLNMHFKNRLIILFDNCNLTLAKDLEADSLGTNHSIISLYHNLEGSIRDHYYIDASKTKDVTNSLTDDLFVGFPDSDKQRIKRISAGFPSMPVFLKKISSSTKPFFVIDDQELVFRYLGIKDFSCDEYKVIRACSLFKTFGYDANAKYQSDAIATNFLISRINGADENKKIIFHSCCAKLIQRGILEEIGRRLFVKPIPLALYLAADWWMEFPNNEIENFLKIIKDNQLLEDLCEQVSLLNFSEKAQQVTQNICESFFVNAEVFNTEEGSRLFRALVVVNPNATIDTLVKIFGNSDLDQLKLINRGRRNLIWALEKLCFRKETFQKAAKVLLSFSAAENENYTNNATGQFLHLFQIHLAGTEVDLNQRTEIIKYALSKPEKEYKALGVSALSRALLSDHFVRHSGAEEQGSAPPLNDYDPTTEEVFDYWKNIVGILYQIATSKDEFNNTAFNALINHVRGLCSIGASSIILPVVEKLIEENQHDSIEIYNSLKFTYRFEKKRLHPNLVSKIKGLIEKLKPNDFKSIYKTTVASPNWEDYDEEGSFTEIVIKKSEKVSEEFCNRLNKLTPEFYFIFQGEQQNGFYFGKKLAELTNDEIEKQNYFFSFSMNALLATEKDKRNASVLAGFIAGIGDKETQRNYLLQIKNNVDLKYLSFMLTSSLSVDKENLLSLFDLIDNKTFFIWDFLVFKYGRALDKISSEDVLTFVKKVSEYGLDGKWTALSVIYMYCFSNQENWKLSKEFIKHLVLTDGILSYEEVNFSIDLYHWSDSVIKILKESNEPLFAEEITKEIIHFYDTTKHIYHTDPYITNVLIVLIENYFDTVWPILNKALLSVGDHYLLYNHLKYSIGSHIGGMGDKVGILFRGNHEKIFAWCQENVPLAPLRIVNMAPIFNDDMGQITWYSFTKRLIDEFGNIDGFLEELSANLGTWSWSGSVVPLLKGKKTLIKELETHHFIEVRRWAANELEKLEKQIKLETYEDAERFI